VNNTRRRQPGIALPGKAHDAASLTCYDKNEQEEEYSQWDRYQDTRSGIDNFDDCPPSDYSTNGTAKGTQDSENASSHQINLGVLPYG
jgi:hypothetical protein